MCMIHVVCPTKVLGHLQGSVGVSFPVLFFYYQRSSALSPTSGRREELRGWNSDISPTSTGYPQWSLNQEGVVIPSATSPIFSRCWNMNLGSQVSRSKTSNDVVGASTGLWSQFMGSALKYPRNRSLGSAGCGSFEGVQYSSWKGNLVGVIFSRRESDGEGAHAYLKEIGVGNDW